MRSEVTETLFEAFRPVADLMAAYGPADDVNLGHPYFARVTPRTMLIDEVEAIWAPIADSDDWNLFETALDEIAQMRDAYGVDP